LYSAISSFFHPSIKHSGENWAPGRQESSIGRKGARAYNELDVGEPPVERTSPKPVPKQAVPEGVVEIRNLADQFDIKRDGIREILDR